MSAKKITVIPATISPSSSSSTGKDQRRRVAGYARVSTESDEQTGSYEAQIDYYTKFILSHENWEFVKVYTDEGISGTHLLHRDGFNEMINDAMDGKIDLIITKSVSRFARNTVDSLTTIRKLKDKGVEVFFEKKTYTLWIPKANSLLRSSVHWRRKKAATFPKTFPGANENVSRTERSLLHTVIFSGMKKVRTVFRS